MKSHTIASGGWRFTRNPSGWTQRLLPLALVVLASPMCLLAQQEAPAADADKRALRIADNQSALLAGWDGELMKAELAELQASGFDLDQLGFDPDELANWGIVGEDSAADPDEPGGTP